MKYTLVYLLAFIFLFSFTSAQPSFITAVNDQSIILDPLMYDVIKQGQDFMFHVHAYNSTSGLNLSNTTLKLNVHLYNSSGNHILRMNNVPFDSQGNDWEVTILGGNFTSPGHYAIEVWVTNGTIVGGSERIFFEVTYSGRVLTSSQGMVYSFLLILFVGFIVGLVYFGKSIETKNTTDELGNMVGINWWKYGRPVAFALVWILVMLSAYITSNIAFAYLPDEMLGKFFFSIYRLMGLISIVLIPYTAIYLLVRIIQESKIQNLLKRGINPNE